VLLVSVQDVSARAALEAALGHLAEGQLVMTMQVTQMHLSLAAWLHAHRKSSTPLLLRHMPCAPTQMFPMHILAAMAASAGMLLSSSPAAAGRPVPEAGNGHVRTRTSGLECAAVGEPPALPTVQQLARSHQDVTLLFME
jgi:hypothetical protein